MVVFVTGATGYIGSAVVRELLQAGHKVVGLSRSDRGAERLKEAGAEVRRGSLGDLDGLRTAAAAADGIIHLAFDHEGAYSDFAASLTTDLMAIQAMGGGIEAHGICGVACSVWPSCDGAFRAPSGRQVGGAAHQREEAECAVHCPLDDHCICILADKGLHERRELQPHLYPVTVLRKDPAVLLPGGQQSFLGVVE